MKTILLMCLMMITSVDYVFAQSNPLEIRLVKLSTKGLAQTDIETLKMVRKKYQVTLIDRENNKKLTGFTACIVDRPLLHNVIKQNHEQLYDAVFYREPNTRNIYMTRDELRHLQYNPNYVFCEEDEIYDELIANLHSIQKASIPLIQKYDKYISIYNRLVDEVEKISNIKEHDKFVDVKMRPIEKELNQMEKDLDKLTYWLETVFKIAKEDSRKFGPVYVSEFNKIKKNRVRNIEALINGVKKHHGEITKSDVDTTMEQNRVY